MQFAIKLEIKLCHAHETLTSDTTNMFYIDFISEFSKQAFSGVGVGFEPSM